MGTTLNLTIQLIRRNRLFVLHFEYRKTKQILNETVKDRRHKKKVQLSLTSTVKHINIRITVIFVFDEQQLAAMCTKTVVQTI